MVIRLILLFTIIPLLELYLLIQIGQCLGAFSTIAIVLLTGITGGFLARNQGLSVYRQISMDLQNGVIPTESLLDGLFILVAGVLLITPGLMTDILGFLIMVPIFRRWFKTKLKTSLKHRIERNQYKFYSERVSSDWRRKDDF